jgi:hypothetical protein
MIRRDGTDIPPEAWDELYPRLRVLADSPPWTMIRPPINCCPLTAVVVGAFRGGTSFVAEHLLQLGVPMGESWSYEPDSKHHYVTYEDAELATAIDPKDFALLKMLVAARNEKYPIWGFKKPSLVFFIDKVLPLLRNPHMIAIVRDPLASHQSERSHGVKGDDNLNIGDCRGHFAAVMDVIEKPRGPTLAISFERGKERPGEVREAIKEFLGI